MTYFLKPSADRIHISGVGSCAELVRALPALTVCYADSLSTVLAGAHELAATTGMVVCGDCDLAARELVRSAAREVALAYAERIMSAVDEAATAGCLVWIWNDHSGGARLVISEGDRVGTPHHVIMSGAAVGE